MKEAWTVSDSVFHLLLDDANFSSSGDDEDEGALSDLLDEDDANYLNSSLTMLSEDFVEKNVVEEKASGGCCSLF